jgi:hypothetical protein
MAVTINFDLEISHLKMLVSAETSYNNPSTPELHYQPNPNAIKLMQNETSLSHSNNIAIVTTLTFKCISFLKPLILHWPKLYVLKK